MNDIVRKLATVETILAVNPIENADAICAYTVRAWKVVDTVGKYKVGDTVIYCEIDSWLPNELAPFLSKGKEPREYLGVKGERLRTVKLRGQVSQGLLLSPSTLFNSTVMSFWQEGEDLTEVLGILKWEPPFNAQLAGMAKGNFPSFIRKTDEERIQNIKRDITHAFYNGNSFEVTLKMDGSSCTTYYNNGELGVCSRNINLKLDQEGNSFVNIANNSGLLKALKSLGKNIAVQGELMAPGIQGNREKLENPQLFIFNIFNIDTQEYVTPNERKELLNELYNHNYIGSHVPVIYENYVLQTDDIDELLKLAEGKSLNHPIREGLVFKRVDGLFSFKIINNQFLVKEK